MKYITSTQRWGYTQQLLLWFFFSFTSNAPATFSLAAYEAKTGLFGAASASDMKPKWAKDNMKTDNINQILTILIPEKGVVVIQGKIINNQHLRKKATEMLQGHPSGFSDAEDFISQLRKIEIPKIKKKSYDKDLVQYMVIVKVDNKITTAIHNGNQLTETEGTDSFTINFRNDTGIDSDKDILLFAGHNIDKKQYLKSEFNDAFNHQFKEFNEFSFQEHLIKTLNINSSRHYISNKNCTKHYITATMAGVTLLKKNQNNYTRVDLFYNTSLPPIALPLLPLIQNLRPKDAIQGLQHPVNRESIAKLIQAPAI